MKILTTLLSAAVLASAGLAFSDEKDAASDEAVIAAQLPSYPLTECLISKEPLDAMGEPLNLVYEGRLVRFCCKGCVKGFKKKPAETLAQIDAAVVAEQGPIYPLPECVISGEKLGSIGEPFDLVHGTRLVRLCCKGCVKGFKKSPEKGMAKVDAALVAQLKKSYPTDTCPVSGEVIEGEGVDYLYGVQLVRFCCPKCKDPFQKSPQKYLAKLEEAKKGTEDTKASGTGH